MRTQGLHVDFAQHVKFSPCAWNCLCAGFWVSVLTMKARADHLVPLGFWKSDNLFRWSWDCKFGGPSISGTQLWARTFMRIDHWGSTRRLCKKCQFHSPLKKDNGIFGLVRHQKLFHGLENFPQLRALTPIYRKISILPPENWIAYLGARFH